ncbi:MAG: endolytic transglycosylase MltG [Clostridiales bacterium]|nr:endolytic transglycosylase MltG [Clostridiales bacterium]
MNKLKDMFYNHNDIVIACVIVLIAALVIVTRVDVLMGYPSMAAQQAIADAEANLPADPIPSVGDIEDPDGELSGSIEGDDPVNGDEPTGGEGDTPEPPVVDEPPVTEPEPQPEPQPEPEPEGPTPGTPVTVTIPSGSTGADVAQALLDAGLISSKDEFYKAVVEAEADTKLQAGTFDIPAGSSLDEIVKILTN